jgi:hypothetical protein
MAQVPFVQDPTLTAVAIAYRNPKLIADMVLPRVAPVGKKDYGYNTYPLGQAFTVPNTAVGRRGTPNQLSFEAQRQTATAEDFGLDDAIPQDDIDQAAAQREASGGAGHDPVAASTQFLTDIVMLDREIRAANLVFNLNTYDAARRVTLSGTSQFNDFVNSDPLGVFETALVSTLGYRANTVTLGQEVWSIVRRHPHVVKAAYGTGNDRGLVETKRFAEILEVDQVLVGDAWVNTARPGQAPTLSRVWGKHISCTYLNPLADRERGITFGMSVPYGTRIAMTAPDTSIGLRGGTRVRVGETIDEIICAPSLGYFIQNAVA